MACGQAGAEIRSDGSPSLTCNHEAPIVFNCNARPDEMRFTLEAVKTASQNAAVAFQTSQSGCRLVDAHATLDSNNGSRRYNGVVQGMQVRRLTPKECERLQGFPDNYTNIPWRNKPESPDGPRYKALGNSMAVPVMRWIGERMQAVEEL